MSSRPFGEPGRWPSVLIQQVEQCGRREQQTDLDSLEDKTQDDNAEQGSEGEWSNEIEAQLLHGGRVWTSPSASAALHGFGRRTAVVAEPPVPRAALQVVPASTAAMRWLCQGAGSSRTPR